MSVLALARDLGSTRHGVLHVLGQHLEVVAEDVEDAVMHGPDVARACDHAPAYFVP